MYLTLFLIFYTSQHISFLCQQLPPNQDSHSKDRPPDHHLHRLIIMNSNFPSDPKAPLTSKELAILLMNNCMDRVLEERAHTKELINDKAETVVAGIVHGMRDGFATMSGIIKSQGESIANLELKCETYNTYLEQLMYRHVLDITPDLGTKPASFNCSVCVKNPSMPRDISATLKILTSPTFIAALVCLYSRVDVICTVMNVTLIQTLSQ